MPHPVVLVIRDDDRFTSILRQQGIQAESLPLIRTEPVADPGLLIEKLRDLSRFDGIILTSPAAAKVFLEHGRDAARVFPGRFYSLGNRVKAVLEDAGLTAVCSDSANTATELIEQLGVSEFSGKRLLFVRGNRSLRTIPALLGTIAELEEVIAYFTVDEVPSDGVLSNVRERLRSGQIDWICFFSPSGVENFIRYFGNELTDASNAAAIGETTAEAAKSAKLNVRFVSPNADAAVFAKELAGHIAKNEQ